MHCLSPPQGSHQLSYSGKPCRDHLVLHRRLQKSMQERKRCHTWAWVARGSINRARPCHGLGHSEVSCRDDVSWNISSLRRSCRYERSTLGFSVGVLLPWVLKRRSNISSLSTRLHTVANFGLTFANHRRRFLPYYRSHMRSQDTDMRSEPLAVTPAPMILTGFIVSSAQNTEVFRLSKQLHVEFPTGRRQSV